MKRVTKSGAGKAGASSVVSASVVADAIPVATAVAVPVAIAVTAKKTSVCGMQNSQPIIPTYNDQPSKSKVTKDLSYHYHGHTQDLRGVSKISWFGYQRYMHVQ